MIVQCELCTTRFKLDDAKLKDEGVRVRCSKCRHIFVVKKEKPETPDDTDFDTLLNGLVSGGQASGLLDESVSDKPEQTQAEEVSPAQSDTQKQEYVPSEFVPDDFSSEFSPDIFHSDTGSSDKESAALAVLQESQVFNKDTDTVFGDSDLFSTTEKTGDSEDTNAFSSFMASEEVHQNEDPASDVPSQVSSSFDIEFPDVAVQGVVLQEPSQHKGSEIGDRSNEMSGTGLSAVDWDISGSFDGRQIADDSSHAGNEPEKAEFQLHVDRHEITPDSLSVPEELPSEPLPPASGSRKMSGSRLPLVIAAVSVLLIIAVSGAGLYIMNTSPSTLEKIGAGAFLKWVGTGGEEGGITIRNTASEFVLNREAGELFVIRGEAFHSLSLPRVAIQIKATLYDAKGASLMSKRVNCGNSLTRDQLVTLPLSELEASLGNQAGDTVSKPGLQSGKSIPFMIVFSAVPRNATEFGLEIIGSSDAGR